MKPVLILLLSAMAVHAQLSVNVSSVRATGSTAVIPLAMKNSFGRKIESARAVVFLLNEQGKMVAQGTRWVIGGGEDKPGLAAGGTNAFHFVIQGNKAFNSTNLTAKVSFSRIVLEGGRLADVAKDVQIQVSEK